MTKEELINTCEELGLEIVRVRLVKDSEAFAVYFVQGYVLEISAKKRIAVIGHNETWLRWPVNKNLLYCEVNEMYNEPAFMLQDIGEMLFRLKRMIHYI